MKKTHIALWLIIMIIMVVSLTLIGYLLNKKNGAYYDLESKIESSAKAYLAQYPEKHPEGILILTAPELIESKFLNNFKIEEERCNGYVTVKKVSISYSYTPYIKCEKYQTKKLNEDLLKELD